jgi:hypothetical protein
MMGAASRITCRDFNRLSKAEQDGALSWAMGYASGMATTQIEDARLKGEDTSALLERKYDARIFAERLKKACASRPKVYYPLMAEWTFVDLMWNERPRSL